MTGAKAARAGAGLSAAEAAKRAGISLGHLRRVERAGAPYALARRLAALYGCPLDAFRPGRTTGKEGGRTHNRNQRR